MAYMQSLPFLDAFDGADRSLFDGTTSMMDAFWGSTCDVRFDAALGINSILPPTTAMPHMLAKGFLIFEWRFLGGAGLEEGSRSLGSLEVHIALR